jgi:hypothetical protein
VFFKLSSVVVCVVFLILLVLSISSCTTYPTASTTYSPYNDLFTATYSRIISVMPINGEPGTTVTISGRDFKPSTALIVWFDSNGNSLFNNDEPFHMVTVNADRNFPNDIELVVPSLPVGDYHIYIETAWTSDIKYFIEFHITGFPLTTVLSIVPFICLIVIIIMGILINKKRHTHN